LAYTGDIATFNSNNRTLRSPDLSKHLRLLHRNGIGLLKFWRDNQRTKEEIIEIPQEPVEFWNNEHEKRHADIQALSQQSESKDPGWWVVYSHTLTNKASD
jgi:hypothetical protein